MVNELLYVIPAGKYGKNELIELLKEHSEIKFVSLVGIDLAGNDTDEKIPMELFLKDMDEFFQGSAVQTDGSSVVLTGIATLNNAKVDMPADSNVNWFVDYNYNYIDEVKGKPVGTLRIPAFLVHNGLRVDSRAILADSLSYIKSELISLFKKYPKVAGLEHINGEEIEDIIFTSGTELEFWVKTPVDKAEVAELSASQTMQEQYWQRTRGSVRTALEQTIVMLDNYGLKTEMGHKEVGGIKATIDEAGNLTHVCEQLEIDWRFADALQAADNELQARIVVKEVFRANGLEVTFKAKPIIGVAGNGEHTHVGFAAKMKSGKLINLFAPTNMKEDFMSAVGYGSLMGLLKNYEAINPFITATNDALNRLKPGFEAPVCIVTSLGHTPEIPSRNRTILAGLVRDVNNPLATRFEVRAANPYTNTYVALSAIYLSMLDGVKAVVASGKNTKEILAELSKEAGTPGFYLETDRAYRSEHDVFEDYEEDERNRLFGKPPATVWENMENLKKFPAKTEVIKAGNILRQEILDAFVAGALIRWSTELLKRIIPENLAIVKAAKPLHDADSAVDYDLYLWDKVNSLRLELAKDTVAQKSIFTRVNDAVAAGDYDTASALQIEMYGKVEELKIAYAKYKRNII
ncbi:MULTISPECIES: glutamine synthetase [Pelosinus]|uniref:glutamine synthetase n=1 Tax=Pelosinus fermentans B4 TaxID=1149862 RepID=I9LBU1_9FIRM|nr:MULTISPECIES: glutamine synthetase [Pelosinus]EIW17874.1 glutamine synthetase catalytic region [Pelosinus fermentans B4]EIW23836.1 glutamine synthetase catalytic region [Pelosinus fermentans A11]OAM94759.1 glutamine synthetase catalytic region [Pelosinus fermentans DSM 17108]SDR16933.1 glutamine synthetase [Pelosinus fermentans]